VARFEGDAAWPASVWGAKPAIAYEPDALAHRVERLQASLVGEGFQAGISVEENGSNQGFTP